MRTLFSEQDKACDLIDGLRDYQAEATQETERVLSESSSALIVMPTGCGKTQTFLTIAGRYAARARRKVLIIAHRAELVWQPYRRWKAMTGEYPEMEMGPNQRAFRSRSDLIMASKDSLHPERLKTAFPEPHEVGLIVIDEAHRCVAKNASYRHILDYFRRGNPDCKVLGVTATPDRADEEALGTLFETVSYEYDIFDPAGGPAAINDGYLVPLRAEVAVVDDVQMDLIATNGEGDLRTAALEKEMVAERPLHRIAGAAEILCNSEKSLIFTAGRDHACRVAEILNRGRAGSARAIVSNAKNAPGWVVDAGDEEARAKVLRAYERGEFPYLVNMGVLTEGFDDPGIMNLVMGRPTKSRALYAQMVGRGTRILPNVIEGKREDGTYWRHGREDRLAAIADSGKPFARVIDFTFTGNTKHSLISAIDILGGKVSDEVTSLAMKNVGKKGSGDVIDELKAAAQELAAQRRAAIRATMQVETHTSRAIFDPLAVISKGSAREPGWAKGKQSTEKQRDAMLRFGMRESEIDGMSMSKASKMIGELIKRMREGKATYRQACVLVKHGRSPDVSRAEASAIIDDINASRRGGTRSEGY